ncbi:deoxyguanosinetriphosphate triphosphohydrolase [Immundisolibacter sp.]|uniref:deoxyguanosinetriphosphate triphosphohydrolase n=1 Tax=Immundisolibacter sp. TaxID=1934948 RepID=UPI001989DADD|nr:deoxyguanosinetriphosphate triphosphohydrolase [Immundisolibacter sp.]MBC7162397.1 deoxyguanosinetriphosphate triphosphohydrolase [Immundisolibacter sp.]MEA3219712.1 Deoxyguanosinetriphosphate triphosphohydrolase-like protein [Immundisolibacter sp.]
MALAPYAASDHNSRGRRHAEPAPADRTEHQRDRDRIIHCSAFRRLEYKTQVFVNHEGDMFRTRLTHSLEVAQICRSLARSLGLSEELAEAISLAHDLGHTPFGHAGQDALNACMADYGGFEHNVQSLRIVDSLEQRYPTFPGINLSFETREGILKHCAPQIAAKLGDVGERFLSGGQPTLEAQLTNLADEIAYNSHDLDDGLRAGMLSFEQLADESTFFKTHHDAVHREFGALPGRVGQHEIIRRIIKAQIADLRETSAARLAAAGVTSLDAVRCSAGPLIAFGDAMRADNDRLKAILNRRVYQHYRVRRMSSRARRVVTDLFGAFLDDPLLLPPDSLARVEQRERDHGRRGRARAVADYVAGMTDRYALAQHSALLGSVPD